MKYCSLFIVSFFFSLSIAKSQTLSVKRIATIESFMTALFRDNKSQKFIIENYMYLPLIDTISLKKKEEYIGILIDTLKNNYSGVVTSPGYIIASYSEFKGEKKRFSDSLEDIAIVTVHNKPVIYFYFYEDRIYSFTLIGKGSENYFIVI
ncbi:MAG: hypothetical protein EOO42_00025 [Flavobacteriales bacterium]|nr:MAG: hypothetical protein EOO42_00025 [Flavobacteriales bacterium]